MGNERVERDSQVELSGHEHHDAGCDMHAAEYDENSVLDVTRYIVSTYAEVQDVEIVNDQSISFTIEDNMYAIFLPEDFLTGMPYIATIRKSMMQPHILPVMQITSDSMLGSLCLFESETVVGLYLDYKDKVKLCMSQLLRLINLSRKERVAEYQKEFTYYWNKAAFSAKRSKLNRNYISSYSLFLADGSDGEWLNTYDYSKGEVRLCSSSIQFNDSEHTIKSLKSNWEALYLPILDASEIVPPTEEQSWSSEHIVDIVCGVQKQRISSEMYRKLSEYSYSKKSAIIIFRLNAFFFGCAVEFKNSGTAKFTVKLESQIEKVIPIRIERSDFKFLNTAIGNVVALADKKIAVIGAGSLGSYVCEELVRSGIKCFTIIDGDGFEPANIMRHRLDYGYNGISKASGLAYKLRHIHPEVIATPVDQYINAANCLSIIPNDVDMLIFTVGSTDIQIACNRILKANSYNKPVLFAWLEGDGESSHVVSIRYNIPGCFECLFTDDRGNHCECIVNISNDIDPIILRNGCGGTRIAYGNSTLLSASKIILEAVAACFAEENSGKPNSIISYEHGQVIYARLPNSELCGCCGKGGVEGKRDYD